MPAIKTVGEKILEAHRALTPMDRLLYWINERERIRVAKESGQPKPWTNDPILQSYRFCNVRREDDKVTRWIAKYWRDPFANDAYIWFAMVVARLVNWPDTLQEIGYPIPWNQNQFIGRMIDRQQRKEKLFTGAYMIHADATHGGTKAEYLAECVLSPLWTARNLIKAECSSLERLFTTLREYRDMGEFMSGQVVADVKYTPLLNKAKDWWTWATPGPGSRRGLNRLLGRHPNEPWKVKDWQEELDKVRKTIHNEGIGNLHLHAQDVQNCLCEFDKYNRVLFGEGKPRSKYQGV